MRAIRIAVVQARDGHLTCVGPNDVGDQFSDQVDAALSWHIEAGHLPAALYWVEVEIPDAPPIAELRAQSERGQFPKSFIEEMEA